MKIIPSESLSGKFSVVTDTVNSLPPEAIVKVFEIVGDIITTKATLKLKHADFVNEMSLMRETNSGREKLMTTLSSLLTGAEINDEAKLRLVETICTLALR